METAHLFRAVFENELRLSWWTISREWSSSFVKVTFLFLEYQPNSQRFHSTNKSEERSTMPEGISWLKLKNENSFQMLDSQKNIVFVSKTKFSTSFPWKHNRSDHCFKSPSFSIVQRQLLSKNGDIHVFCKLSLVIQNAKQISLNHLLAAMQTRYGVIFHWFPKMQISVHIFNHKQQNVSKLP